MLIVYLKKSAFLKANIFSKSVVLLDDDIADLNQSGYSDISCDDGFGVVCVARPLSIKLNQTTPTQS